MAISHVSVLSPGALILVTGVNGFIGGHVALDLLSRGYRVIGTVRDEKKAEWATKFFARFEGQFKPFVMGDMSAPGAFSEIIRGVEGIAHVASPTSFSSDPKEVITVAVDGVLSLMRAAAQETSVKRFVYTSSSVAVSFTDSTSAREVTAKTWNTESIKAAWDPSDDPNGLPRPFLVYAASKTAAEMEAFKFVAEQKPSFVFNSVLPTFTLGKVLDWEGQNPSTAGMLRAVLEQTESPIDVMQIVTAQHFVDVGDVARLHYGALSSPNVQNERLFAFADRFTWTRILGILRQLRPGYDLPKPPSPDDTDLTIVPNNRALEVLQELGQKDWVDLESTLALTVEGVPERKAES